MLWSLSWAHGIFRRISFMCFWFQTKDCMEWLQFSLFSNTSSKQQYPMFINEGQNWSSNFKFLQGKWAGGKAMKNVFFLRKKKLLTSDIDWNLVWRTCLSIVVVWYLSFPVSTSGFAKIHWHQSHRINCLFAFSIFSPTPPLWNAFWRSVVAIITESATIGSGSKRKAPETTGLVQLSKQYSRTF